MTASPTIPLLLNTNFSDQWIIRNSQDSETNAYQSESGIFSTEKSFAERFQSQIRESLFSIKNYWGVKQDKSSLANLFANGWVIENESKCNTQQVACDTATDKLIKRHLIVEYAPQNLFNITLLFSLTCHFIALLILTQNAVRNFFSRGVS